MPLALMGREEYPVRLGAAQGQPSQVMRTRDARLFRDRAHSNRRRPRLHQQDRATRRVPSSSTRTRRGGSNGPAVGKRSGFAQDQWEDVEVVGVVREQMLDARRDDSAGVYVPMLQHRGSATRRCTSARPPQRALRAERRRLARPADQIGR